MRRLLVGVLALAIAACSNAASVPPATSLPSAAVTAATTPSDGPVRIPLSGAAPDALAIDGDTAWVLTGEGGTLLEIDLAARHEVRSIEVGFGATHLALVADGTAAVARFDDSATGTFLPVVDLETGTVEGVATGALGGLSRGESGIVWALERTGRVLKIDTESRSVLGEAAVDIGANVHTEVQWGAGSAWVGSDGSPVVRLRATDLTSEATIPVDTGLPLLAADGLVWGAGPEQVWAIDPASNAVIRRVELHDVSEVLALDIDGDDAWLAVRHPGQVGAVLHLDLAGGTVLSEEAVSLPAAVRIAPDRVWVASYLTNELLGFQR